MHELSLCRSLLREAQRVADAHAAAAVTEIVVAVGPLSGVEAPLLRSAFRVARAGTVAESAALQIERPPVVVWCPSCAAETDASANALRCGRCGTWRVQLRSGNELLLKRVELAGVDAAAAAASG